MNDTDLITNNEQPPKASNPWKTFGIAVIVLVFIVMGALLLKNYLFPTEFSPVTLSERETSTLNEKLQSLNLPTIQSRETTSSQKATTALKPQAYSEKDAGREVSFSEKEINAMIAHNTDLADKFAIDLSDNLASAQLLLPLDPDMPFVGGKTLKLSAGVEIAFRNSRPVVKLRGVSAWGIPVPNEWLGNLKNVDLINEFGGQDGFWKSFSNGIDYVEITDGELQIKLKE